MSDWSMLPCDVVGEIALKLDEIEDYIYFSAVCRSWNCACSLVKPKWKPKTTTMPWMLLAENTKDNPDCLRKVYNLSNNKCYQLELPETFGARCWGSYYGWLVLQTYDFEVHLFNPLTRVRITSLPSLLTLPCTPFDPLEKQQWYFKKFVVRIVVLKMPHTQHWHPPTNGGGGDDLIIAAIYGEFEYLAFARPGDKAWTDIYVKAEDVFFWGDLIYIISLTGRLLYCDFKRFAGDLKDLEILHYVPSCVGDDLGLTDKLSLLDLCGDLVMVVHSKEEDDFSYFTKDLQVYRLDHKSKKWMRIEDIGNFAIFIGNNSSMCVPVSEDKNCMKNCIYFTDDENRYYDVVRGKDMGVYNMSSRDITKFYEGDDTSSLFCPPMFFVPCLN